MATIDKLEGNSPHLVRLAAGKDGNGPKSGRRSSKKSNSLEKNSAGDRKEKRSGGIFTLLCGLGKKKNKSRPTADSESEFQGDVIHMENAEDGNGIAESDRRQDEVIPIFDNSNVEINHDLTPEIVEADGNLVVETEKNVIEIQMEEAPPSNLIDVSDGKVETIVDITDDVRVEKNAEEAPSLNLTSFKDNDGSTARDWPSVLPLGSGYVGKRQQMPSLASTTEKLDENATGDGAIETVASVVSNKKADALSSRDIEINESSKIPPSQANVSLSVVVNLNSGVDSIASSESCVISHSTVDDTNLESDSVLLESSHESEETVDLRSVDVDSKVVSVETCQMSESIDNVGLFSTDVESAPEEFDIEEKEICKLVKIE